MRQVLSWRFVATIGALFALTVIVYFAFGNRQSVAEVVQDQTVQTRRADLITLDPRLDQRGLRRRRAAARPARSPCRCSRSGSPTRCRSPSTRGRRAR